MGFISDHNKVVLVAAAILGVSSTSVAAPTVYGLINKEIRTVSQDASENRISRVNVTDVDGFETRLGAKGNIKDDHHDVDYKIELGINSNKDDNSEKERTRIRMASVKFKQDWGHITVGKDWTPDSLRLIALDPFVGTGLQSFGLDNAEINTPAASTLTGGLGYRFRGFQDQFTYQTNNYSGFRFHLTIDDNGNSSQNATGDDGQVTTLMATYDKDFGSVKNDFTLISSSLSYDKSSNHKEKNLQIADKIMFGAHSVSLAYGTQTTGDDGKNKRTFLGYSFTRDKARYALSYSNADIESAAGVKTGSRNQIALGYFHTCNENLTLRFLVGNYTAKAETAETFGGGFATNKSENKGQIISLGGMLKF